MIKQSWQRTARGIRLVRVEVLGSVSAVKRGFSFRRADGLRGVVKSLRMARAIVAGLLEPPPPSKRKRTKAPKRAKRTRSMAAKNAKRTGSNVPHSGAQAETLQAFAARVNAAAAAARPWAAGGSKVYISDVYDRVGGDRAAFGRKLVAAHQADLVTLSRADLVEAMDPAKVAASEVRYLNAEFHLLEKPAAL